jgi:hypothetical protein
VLLGFVLVAFLNLFEHQRKRATDVATRVAEAVSNKSLPTPPEPPVPPETADSTEVTAQDIKKGIEDVKKSIHDALADEEDVKAAMEKAEKAKAAAMAAERAANAANAEGAAVSPEVSQLLSDAEEALDDEDPKLALRLADQSFFTKKTSAGWAIKARAHCQLKDLGNARAALTNVKGKATRAKVLADCKENGVDLR